MQNFQVVVKTVCFHATSQQAKLRLLSQVVPKSCDSYRTMFSVAVVAVVAQSREGKKMEECKGGACCAPEVLTIWGYLGCTGAAKYTVLSILQSLKCDRAAGLSLASFRSTFKHHKTTAMEQEA